MRILTVGNMYPPHHLGGYELIWRSAVRHSRAAGHDVRVLTTDVRFGEPAEPDDPACFRELEWYWRDHAWPRRSLADRVRLERANARTLRRHLGEFRPDVVAWWAMGGMSLSLPSLVRVPSAAFVLDDWLDYAPKEDQWRRMFTRRFDVSSIDHWVFISEYTRERARGLGHTFASSEVNPAGVGEEFLAPAPAQAWAWRLLYVGRIDERKGIDTAVRALAQLPPARRRSTWSAPATTRRRRGCGRSWTSSASPSACGSRASCRASSCPSATRTPTSRSSRSAGASRGASCRWRRWASGAPSSRPGAAGAASTCATASNALLFDAEDPTALAGQITRLANEDGLRERLLAGGLETARAHTAGAHDARVTAILEALPLRKEDRA